MIPNNTISKPTVFEQLVYSIVSEIPCGKVATYTQIATMVGNRNSTRAVGNALHKNPYAPIVPCHRVVSIRGKLAKNFGASGGIEIQKKRLIEEGVSVENLTVDLVTYQWEATPDKKLFTTCS